MCEIIGAIFIIIVGSLSHFVYDWTHHNKLAVYFFPVNESTWEHIKLVIWPSFIWFLVELHVYDGYPNLFFVKFISLLVMILLIPILFYGYTHFTKKPILFVDIMSFVITVIIGETLFHYLMKIDLSNSVCRHIGYIGLFLIFIKYITSTYVPEKNFIFEDPITNKYGIEGHDHKHHH